MEPGNRHERRDEDDKDRLVNLPHAEQGVSDALRSIFVPVTNDLPDDIAALLGKLH